MNLLEFAVKNVRRNAKAYFAYFLSTTISAALLSSFSMIIFHPDFNLSILPNYLKTSLYMTTVIAYLFLTFFVFYSVSVFLKSRYKEFGILYIIGSSNRRIHKMIKIENMIISSSSAVTGILIGLIFSKILIAASGKLLGYNALGFYIPVKAMIITFSAFIIIGIVMTAFCTFIIKEDKVLKLLKGTKSPRTEPKASVILSTICVILLSVGYFLSISCTKETIPSRIIPVTIMVIIATYLLFSQLSVFVIKLLKKNRRIYMKKVTVLWVSNLLYRIKDNTRMFFLITITSTVALSAIGSVYSYWRDKEEQVDLNFPQAFFYSDMYENKDKVDMKADFIEASLKDEGMEYTKVSDEIKFVITGGNEKKAVLMKEDTYKKFMSAVALKPISFGNSETILAAPSNETENVIVDNFQLQVVGKYSKRIIPTLYGQVYVVKEDIYEKVNGTKAYFGAVNVNKYKDSLSVCKKYYDTFGQEEADNIHNNLLKAKILDSTKIAYGVILFIVIFIGLIFFVTTGSFLYNKCYMDVIEDKKKYRQLNKIGLTYAEIKKVLNIEIGVLFLLPYIIAVIHFIFAISSLKYAFDIKIMIPALQLIGIMLIGQIVYFLIIRKNYLLEIRKSLL